MSEGVSTLATALVIGFKIKALRGGGFLVSLTKPLVCDVARGIFSKVRLSLAFLVHLFGKKKNE